MHNIKLDSATAALILIDLQHGILARTGSPYSTDEVLGQCAKLSQRFHEQGARVIYVRVDLNNFLQLNADVPSRTPDAPTPAPGASELVAGAGFQDGDLLITKRHWSAFLGTDMVQQLRAHQITTIVIGGVSTNMGVESTARDAAGLGFQLIFAEDAMTALAPTHHQFAIENIFPRIGRVRKTEQIWFTE